MRLKIAFLVTAASLSAQTLPHPVRAVTDPGIVTTRQAITPAGVPSIFQGRVYGSAWSKSGNELWVLHATELYKLDWRKNQVMARIPHGGTPGNQSIQLDAVKDVPVVGTSARGGRAGTRVSANVITVADGKIQTIAAGVGLFNPGALAIANGQGNGGTRVVVVPLVYENKLAVIDVATGRALNSIATQTAPFAVVVNAAGTAAYVSNLGGRGPKAGEAFASPAQKPEEKIPVDTRGIASTGTVTRIDLRTGVESHVIATGLHPTAMAWDEARHRLYVANGNSESVSVIDTQTNALISTFALQPFAQKVRGIAPTAVAVSSDGGRIYVACGGINAVAVLNSRDGAIAGLIPTGWYPNSVTLSPDGRSLAITSLLGAGSAWRDKPGSRYVHAHRGSVAVVDLPDAAQLAGYTTAVAENNHLPLAGVSTAAERRTSSQAAAAKAIPVRSGDRSHIQHVVYIIKENRTYDQVFGDMQKGNGDPSLVMFGADVTPNQRKLADRYVLLDNFYATGGNSGDGHQWATQANETEYCLWPGYQGRSYPFDGSDPMAYSAGGFIWDYALAKNKSVRVYGEYAGRMSNPPNSARVGLLKRWQANDTFTKEWSIRAPIEPLNKILAANYPSYTNAIPDVVRASIFLEDLKGYETEGNLPNLVILQLPSDHTFGTSPGVSTPKAMVADNDLAVGQIVEALSKSQFWKNMAIFIVEDDAQNGVDHVDGHRTTALVVSPYARRDHVDSTFYSHQSMLKTIELILGLPTMSLFDLIAHDMRNSFTDTPDFTPYESVHPKQDLFEVNPPANKLTGAARAAAIASARMNWSIPDAVPTERLNRIVWGQVMGWNKPYPQTKQALFAPLSLDVEDEDRDERRK
jgi:YVTN family beta-propeller protein